MTEKMLPRDIISINRTQNQQELAEIYTAADVFVNPTREDTYPTVNMESLACGTPVITFKTGGSPEMLDESCGSFVDCDDVDGMEEWIRNYTRYGITQDACVARGGLFSSRERFNEYISLFENIRNVEG